MHPSATNGHNLRSFCFLPISEKSRVSTRSQEMGELERMTRGGPGTGGHAPSFRYIKADHELLAKIDKHKAPSTRRPSTVSVPEDLPLERTLTVPGERLGGARGGSATLKSLLHDGDSGYGHKSWEEIMPESSRLCGTRTESSACLLPHVATAETQLGCSLVTGWPQLSCTYTTVVPVAIRYAPSRI